MADTLASIYAFLERIGIPYTETELPGDTFLPGIKIDGGEIFVDPSKLTYPGDILHEAGHIALTAPQSRSALNQNVLGSQDPKESEEIGVILWSFLAAKEIGLAPEIVIHAGGYRGSSDWYIENFEGGTYIGLPLLTWMGVTENPQKGERPKILSWLRTRE